MVRKLASWMIIALLLVGMAVLTVDIKPAEAWTGGTIYIKADGSIDPPTAPILTTDYLTYLLTDDIYSDYPVNGIVVQRDNITLDGNGHLLQGADWYHSWVGIDLSGRSNVTIENMCIKNFSRGILLDGSFNNTISGNNLEKHYVFGIVLSASLNNTISRNNINNTAYVAMSIYNSYYNNITGNNITKNSVGITLYNSAYNTVSGNNATKNKMGGIDLVNSKYNTISGNIFVNDGLSVSQFSYKNIVEDNLVNGKPLIYLELMSDLTIDCDNPGQVILVDCNGIIVENLNLSHTYAGIQLCTTNNTKITNNSITDSYIGIRLHSFSNKNSIQGNNVTNNFDGITLDSSLNNSISQNNITANLNFGIRLKWFSDHNTIIGNNAAVNLMGIRLVYSAYNIIGGNNITGNDYGIGLEESSNNTISGNNLEAHYISSIYLLGVGISLQYDSRNNTIDRNNVAANEVGIYIDSSINTISRNNVTKNDHGIFVSSIYNWYNKIYHNNFCDNTNHVHHIASTGTKWDDGYPSGGNYWSGYADEDLNSGPDQNIPGSDGIWDHAYIIDAGNQDRYPFVNPRDNTPPVANAGPDQTVDEDTLVTFDGSGSYDNIGLESYVWTFIDITPKALTGVNPTYTFTTPSVYTVNLNVTDATGNWATDTVTITVLALTPEGLTERLIETIETSTVTKGTKKSLTSKLEDVLHLLDISNKNGAVHKLMDFINQVEAQRGKKLTDEQASYWIYQAQKITSRIQG